MFRGDVFPEAVCLVTGAGSGIGRALSLQLAEAGAIVVMADLDPVPVDEAASTIRAAGQRAHACGLDVADEGQFNALIDDIVARHGRLDFLFNNA
ncbi:MAG TPA: SDR family NAD(P)-dependent oxidoreductase, partial [Pirellulaceae bacterium]